VGDGCLSRTKKRIASAMSTAGIPKMTTVSRQPRLAIIAAPNTATATVPTLPPAMWALIANPRRFSGNCSASRPLPTGCCGEPPIRDTTLTAANAP
jgi:hypothetical protein